MDKFIINEEDGLEIFRSVRWSNGVICPHCGFHKIHKQGKYKTKESFY